MGRDRACDGLTHVAAAAGFLALAGSAHGEDWVEPRSNDAGRVAETALFPDPLQTGPLDAIEGFLDPLNPGRGVPQTPTDGQDMFAIWISNPSAFTARAVSVFGSNLTDPQLFLFTAASFGALANDDFQTFDLYPRLSPIASDGTFTLTTPGLYYLAISGAGSIPYSGFLQQPIFSFATATEISGPDGPGGAAVHADWTEPSMYGDYRIELTGVIFVPAPASAGLGVAVALLTLRRRRH